MEKIIPKCPECGSSEFEVSGPLRLHVEITNPKGQWDDQVCYGSDFEDSTKVLCVECGEELPGDMAAIVKFIAFNFLTKEETPFVLPWCREVGKEGSHVARKDE